MRKSKLQIFILDISLRENEVRCGLWRLCEGELL